jgi:hypothetical protein
LIETQARIGVIAWDEQGMFAKFLSNWKRVQSFGHEDIGYVREFVTKASTALDRDASPDLFGKNPTLDVSRLEKMIGTWHHSIQFTSPRASIKSPQALIEDLVPMFLPAPPNIKCREADARRLGLPPSNCKTRLPNVTPGMSPKS